MKTKAQLRAALADVARYLAQLDAMQPKKDHGAEGKRIRKLIASFRSR